MLVDYWRDTPVTYSRGEAALLRKMDIASGARVVCPRCGGVLAVGPPSIQRSGEIRAVYCAGCHRSAMLRLPT